MTTDTGGAMSDEERWCAGTGMHVAVRAGAGVVARYGACVVVAPSPAPTPSDDGLDNVLEIVHEMSRVSGCPGRRLARRLFDRLVEIDTATLPSFAVVAPAKGGWAVVACGTVKVHFVDDEMTVAGGTAGSWVAKVVSNRSRALWIAGTAQEDAGVDGRYDLTAGVVPGQAASIRIERTVHGGARTSVDDPTEELSGPVELGALTRTEPPVPVGAADPPFEIIQLTDVDVSDRAPAEDGSTAGAITGPQVDGILCENGHFCHPSALYCSTCGVATVHNTREHVRGPRPSLGVLVTDDGTTYTLDGGYLIGREPKISKSPGRERLRPLVLRDAERSLSRVHAEIRLRDWEVVLVDLGSANGTFVQQRDHTEWKRLRRETPEAIPPGSVIALGQRRLTFETHHQVVHT